MALTSFSLLLQPDEEWTDRVQILQDARNLKKLADFFMSPEKPVVVDATATARCFFSRPSARQFIDTDEEEVARILADARALKNLAVDYLQPERPVQVDPMLFGRNYFTRPSAPTSEDDEERNQILADAMALKQLAVDYLHPEKPVVASDPCATGRNYFSRFSAEGVDDEGLASERDQILADAESLKKLAVDYLHPEKPVVTSDPYATGRNYFTRASAEEYEQDEEYEERMLVLDDLAALKKLAVDYLCPERPVETDAFAKGRNYFSRYSAEQLDPDELAEKDRILEDMRLLKRLAVDFMHPELPVKTSDPCASGRNYFNRASAVGPSEHIHSEGHSIHQAQQQVHDVPPLDSHHHDLEYSDHEYYQYHPDDHLHSDHQSQSDHFEMDEDMAQDFRDFRESLHTMVPLKGAEAPREEDEGKLSRSPSSVMLFDEAAM